MRELEASFNPEASDFVTCHTGSDSQQAGRENGQAAFQFNNWGWGGNFDTLACLTMLDRLQLGPDDLALAALKTPDPQHIKPEQYKDVFTNPVNFQEALEGFSFPETIWNYCSSTYFKGYPRQRF
jgi:hypothetical protein